MTVFAVVCGSRTWTELSPILARLSRLPKPSTVIEGGCDGADTLARVAALNLGHDVIEIPANWNGRGRYAGPFRNRWMLSLLENLPNARRIVIAFHENLETSRGTADTVREAKKMGIPVEIHRA